MEKNKIQIASKTLKLLEKKSFENITLTEVIGNKKNKFLNSKVDLIININKYFDFLLKDNCKTIEVSTTKDMLFEVMMARLDILNDYRKSVKNIINFLTTNPKIIIKLFPSYIKSIILISTLSNIDINGIKGIPKLKGVFVICLLIIYTWNKDESISLEKTMTTLDKYLDNFIKLINLFDDK